MILQPSIKRKNVDVDKINGRLQEGKVGGSLIFNSAPVEHGTKDDPSLKGKQINKWLHIVIAKYSTSKLH